MFYKLSRVAIALALLVTANGIKKDVQGIRIPLHKRSSLRKPDGTFDLEKAILQTVAIKKYEILYPDVISEPTAHIQLPASTDRTSSTLSVILVLNRLVRYVAGRGSLSDGVSYSSM